MLVRIGDLLVRRGCLSEAQREKILQAQRHAARPFGVLAEEMFGVRQSEVEAAWSEQFAMWADYIDPAAVEQDPEAATQIDTRQAWQFRLIPLFFDDGELVVATCQNDLPRALRFVGWQVDRECRFVLCTCDQLTAGLARHYPMPGMDHPALSGGGRGGVGGGVGSVA